jgi:ABC-type uncharacterized transport system auxiliary subunit
VKTVKRSAAFFAATLVAACVGGCALLGKADPLTPRYFSVEPAEVSAAEHAESASAAENAAPALRMGRVTSASYLGERLVYRNSAYELGFYEDLRWTERPEAYFRRGLARALYEKAGFEHVVSGGGPMLDVDLVEFAELTGQKHTARARVAYALFEGRSVRSEGTITMEVPIVEASGTEKASATVDALSKALSGTIEQIVDRVRTNLKTIKTAPDASGDEPSGSEGSRK